MNKFLQFLSENIATNDVERTEMYITVDGTLSVSHHMANTWHESATPELCFMIFPVDFYSSCVESLEMTQEETELCQRNNWFGCSAKQEEYTFLDYIEDTQDMLENYACFFRNNIPTADIVNYFLLGNTITIPVVESPEHDTITLVCSGSSRMGSFQTYAWDFFIVHNDNEIVGIHSTQD